MNICEAKTIIGVIGAGRASEKGYAMAREAGKLIAQNGAVLVCGGLGGVMEGASRGCAEAGGLVLGILPGDETAQANPYVSLPIVTNMGHARNVIIAHTAQALIAIEGEHGTLSEMAIALKLGRPVAALDSWPDLDGVKYVTSPEEAIRFAFSRIGQR